MEPKPKLEPELKPELKPELVKSNYHSPRITKVVALEVEHPFMAASIIPDNQEVEILTQQTGAQVDFSEEVWN